MVKVKKTYWSAAFNRLKIRTGAKKGIVAIARKLLKTIYYMLKNKTAYAELGAEYIDARMNHKRAKYYEKQLHKLGFEVTLQRTAA